MPTDYELMQAAEAACENAYAPYSGFKVGAALLTGDGNMCGTDRSGKGGIRGLCKIFCHCGNKLKGRTYLSLRHMQAISQRVC